MEQKKALNRKKLKVILVICIVMIVTVGISLVAYIHHVDAVTLGRKVSVYRLDVSKLTVEEAQQKISEAFQNKKITFHEDGKDVYNVSMEQLGYSLDQDILKSALETLKQERSGTFKLFASQRDIRLIIRSSEMKRRNRQHCLRIILMKKTEQNLRMHISDIVKRNRNMCW